MLSQIETETHLVEVISGLLVPRELRLKPLESLLDLGEIYMQVLSLQFFVDPDSLFVVGSFRVYEIFEAKLAYLRFVPFLALCIILELGLLKIGNSFFELFRYYMF